MPLIQLKKVSIAYGDNPLLDKANLQIDPSERVCLVGRNGAGKSTLLNIIQDKIEVDDGVVWRSARLKIGTLAQVLPEQNEQTVYDMVASGLAETGILLKRYHALLQSIEVEGALDELQVVQEKLEAVDGWKLSNKIETVMKRLQLPENKKMKHLSGGWRRRVALAKALVDEPDILLLDEPTNHLDLITIRWLEEYLKSFNGALLFITHDRSFLQALATRIIELDRGNLTSWQCDYKTFLERKSQALEEESTQNALFDKKLAEEEKWIRQGIKARRTRNEGRVRALEALRVERMGRREQLGKASFDIDSGNNSGKLVVEACNITKIYDHKVIIDNLNFSLFRGDKIGLIGANGTGKSTLINILLQRINPDKGDVRIGTRLDVAYFDQLREQLDLNKNVIENVAQGRDFITVNGKECHVISYLSDFLFTAKRCLVPVKALSGGERNRLLLARLFSKPANFLVLDEPTNDLDIETLELLENLLVNFKGTLLIVSHDRSFLDNVVTGVLVFKPQGKIEEFCGGFSDWLRQGGDIEQLVMAEKSQKIIDQSVILKEKNVNNSKPKKKLSYLLQQELKRLPDQIEALEETKVQLERHTVADGFYAVSNRIKADKILLEISQLENKIEEKMSRWEQLDAM